MVNLSAVVDLLNQFPDVIDAFGRSIPSIITLAVYIAVGGAIVAFVYVLPKMLGNIGGGKGKGGRRGLY